MARANKQDKVQAKRFIEAAREAGCSEDEVVFDENMKRLAETKPQPAKKSKKPKKKTESR